MHGIREVWREKGEIMYYSFSCAADRLLSALLCIFVAIFDFCCLQGLIAAPRNIAQVWHTFLKCPKQVCTTQYNVFVLIIKGIFFVSVFSPLYFSVLGFYFYFSL